MRHFHEPAGSDDFNDPGGWNKASYFDDPIDSIEPLPDAPSDYRQAAKFHLGLMFAIDEYVTEAPDSRFAIIVVGIVFGWPSTRGFSIADIASQIGCSPLTITRACARFREMAGLGVSAGGVRFIRPVQTNSRTFFQRHFTGCFRTFCKLAP
jgi:hypothetical protein